MTEMTELFQGTYDTLRGVKRAIDDELDVGPDAPDEATLDRLLSLSRLHAAMTRKLQDMMLDQGGDEALQAEVQVLREAFESTQSEVALRLWTRRGRPMPGLDDPIGDPEALASAPGGGLDMQDEDELLRAAFEQTRRLFALQLQARQGAPERERGGRTRGVRRDQEQKRRADAALRVFHRDASYRVELIEASPGGARLSQTTPLPAGAWVTLRFLHLSVRAQVERSDGAVASLRFRSPLAPADVQALREASGRRLGTASAGALPGS